MLKCSRNQLQCLDYLGQRGTCRASSVASYKMILKSFCRVGKFVDEGGKDLVGREPKPGLFVLNCLTLWHMWFGIAAMSCWGQGPQQLERVSNKRSCSHVKKVHLENYILLEIVTIITSLRCRQTAFFLMGNCRYTPGDSMQHVFVFTSLKKIDIAKNMMPSHIVDRFSI